MMHNKIFTKAVANYEVTSTFFEQRGKSLKTKIELVHFWGCFKLLFCDVEVRDVYLAISEARR
jgi:hypothetical protein